MGWFSKKATSEDEVNRDLVGRAVARVAAATVVGRKAFRQEAAKVVEELAPDAIDALPSFFHNPPQMPADLESHYGGLGAWLAVCQFAGFEILFNYGRAAIPVLLTITYGEYDWTQGNAIEILCRLAALGIEQDQIIRELRQTVPSMRIEALEYAAGPLLEQAGEDSQLKAFITNLDIPEFTQAIEQMSNVQTA